MKPPGEPTNDDESTRSYFTYGDVDMAAKTLSKTSQQFQEKMKKNEAEAAAAAIAKKIEEKEKEEVLPLPNNNNKAATAAASSSSSSYKGGGGTLIPLTEGYINISFVMCLSIVLFIMLSTVFYHHYFLYFYLTLLFAFICFPSLLERFFAGMTMCNISAYFFSSEMGNLIFGRKRQQQEDDDDLVQM